MLQSINVLTGNTATGVSVQQIIQLGMFSIVTYAVELLLEYGFAKMIATILVQIVQGEGGQPASSGGAQGSKGAIGCTGLQRRRQGRKLHAMPSSSPPPHQCLSHAGSLGFFIFRSRTTAYFFWNDVLYGGCGRNATYHHFYISDRAQYSFRPPASTLHHPDHLTMRCGHREGPPRTHACALSLRPRGPRRRCQVHPHRARLRH